VWELLHLKRLGLLLLCEEAQMQEGHAKTGRTPAD